MAKDIPGGTRPPEYIRTMALGRVEDLMIQGYTPHQIFAKVYEEGFTESEATCRDWRVEIQKRWAAEEAEERPARKEGWRHRIMARILRLEEASAKAMGLAKASLEAEITKMYKLGILVDGAHAPIQVAHTVTGTVDVAAMSPVEREREIAALMAKREAALAEARKAKREPGLLS